MRRKIEKQIVQVDQQRIADQPPEIDRMEELLKVLESYPWTFVKTQKSIVILKRDAQAQHRGVAKKHIVKKHGQKHQVKIFCRPDSSPEQCRLRFFLHAFSPP